VRPRELVRALQKCVVVRLTSEASAPDEGHQQMSFNAPIHEGIKQNDIE